MTDRDHLHCALGMLRDVVAGLSTDQLAVPLPGAGPGVRGLLDHLVGWQQVFAACLRGDPAPLLDGSPTYRSGTSPVAALVHDLDRAARDLEAAVAPARSSADLPHRGETSVEVLVAELIAETLLHTWDVATAVGVAIDPPPALVHAAHRGLTLLLGETFAEVGFAAPVTLDAGSAPGGLDALVARSGRRPDASSPRGS